MYRLEDILKSRNISKTELAEMLGVKKQSIPSLLNGNPTKAKLEEIATVLNIPVWQLFVSPEEVSSSPQGPDFIALIKSGNETYSASSVSEAYEILNKIK